MNFMMDGMTNLKYYIPLSEECKKRNIASNYFLVPSGKYHCPTATKNREILDDLSNKFDFNVRDIKDLDKFDDWPIFTIEGSSARLIPNNFRSKICAITYMTDFSVSYESYINDVDLVFFPSEYFAEYYGKTSEKNRYCGSPKYDYSISRESVLKKYKIPNSKNILIIAPKSRDLGKSNLSKIVNDYKRSGFYVIMKTRGKDRIPDYGVDLYCSDGDWFPHPTDEFIEASDLIVNFSSTAVKEVVLRKKPLINFHVKPFPKPLGFLYEGNYCLNLNPDIESEELILKTEKLINDHSLGILDYDNAIKKYLFESKGTSKKIIDEVTMGI